MGVRGLVRKLWIDRNVLIPRLVNSNENKMKQAFTGRLEDFSRLYFTSIKGLDSVIFPAKGASATFDESYHPSYTLTERGKSYEHNRDGTMSIIGVHTWPTYLLERAQSCLSDITSRHDVFPRGKAASDRESTWNGPDLASGSHQPEPGRQWMYWPGTFYPEFFEHRPGMDRCDL